MKSLLKSPVVIAIGAGGVGKTTVASALGIYFAKQGFKTLVITIDPARRLLDAMGVKENADEPCQVLLDDFIDKKPSGELFVLMPNLKKEWASFLEASIAKTDVRHKISGNKFYQHMVSGMPGALEIICSHVLYGLLESGRFEKIILDTPPSSHSISFFDVPQKISRVLEQSVFRALMSNRNSMLLKLTKKLAFFSGGILQNTFERIIGSHFFSELIDFALSIDALYEPLLFRVRAMDQLLKKNTTKYALIVRPSITSVNDGAVVKSALRARGIHIEQIIVNLVMPPCDEEELAKEIKNLAEYDNINRLVELYKKEVSLEQKLIKDLQQEFPHTDRRILFMTKALMSRATLLKSLVADLEGVS